MEYLRNKTQQLWKLGSCIAIDEDRARVCSKLRRNKFKIRNPDKPIRMGWTVCKLADVGENGVLLCIITLLNAVTTLTPTQQMVKIITLLNSLSTQETLSVLGGH